VTPPRWLALVVATMLGGCVAYVDSDALIRPATGERLADETPVADGWQLSNHGIPLQDGTELYLALFRRPDADALLVYFGGNHFTISQHHAALLRIYHAANVDVLVADHRGYGGSTGTASLAALMADALRVHDFARSLPQYAGRPLLVHGQSLGSFMAGEVARHRPLDGLVLESSATTAEEWVQGFVDASPFVRRGVVQGELQGRGNLALMADLDTPLLIVVGERDRTTRSTMSQRLFEAAQLPPDSKELLIVPGAGHNDAARHPAFAEAFARLLARAVRRADESTEP